MELFVRIVSQGEAETREVTTRRGEKINLTTMPFTLNQGDDTFFAEMFGEKALAQPQLRKDHLYVADIQLTVREVTNDRGSFIKNTITLRSITEFIKLPPTEF